MAKHKHRHQKSFFINKFIVVVAVIEPLITLPQAYIIFHNQDASDISLLSWIGYDLMTIIWVWYAWVNKEKVVFIYQALFFITNTLVIIGAIIYGGKWF
ncbi:MAG: hypothetical protein WCP11_02315 [Candidatus Saccharibacteria bacterium]